MGELLQQPHKRLLIQQALNTVYIGAKQQQKLGQIRRVPFIAQIGLCNTHLALARHTHGKSQIPDNHGGFWPVDRAAKQQFLSGRQFHKQLAGLNLARQSQSFAHPKRKRPAYGFQIISCDDNRCRMRVHWKPF